MINCPILSLHLKHPLKLKANFTKKIKFTEMFWTFFISKQQIHYGFCTGYYITTIVSGIAEFYSPEDMKGRQICILANLKPRVIRGIESRGMILMAKQGDGSMRFITPQELVSNGSQVG